MNDEKQDKEMVYLLFERIGSREYLKGVYKTRKAAWAEKKRLREAEPDRTITYPIVAYEVED